jgi:hypothetical protein
MAHQEQTTVAEGLTGQHPEIRSAQLKKSNTNQNIMLT